MRSVALLLFGIHLAFADDPSITCVDVTGSVEEKLTLTCSVSILNNRCCISMYKFIQIARDDQTICREEFSTDHCEQMDSFSCSYTVKTAMTTPFQFFLQTTCGVKTSQFTVNVTGKTSTEIVRVKMQQGEVVTDLSKVTVTSGCVLGPIIAATIMGVIVWMRSSQVKRRNLKGCVSGSNADSVSDQEMQKYPSSHSMEHNPPLL